MEDSIFRPLNKFSRRMLSLLILCLIHLPWPPPSDGLLLHANADVQQFSPGYQGDSIYDHNSSQISDDDLSALGGQNVSFMATDPSDYAYTDQNNNFEMHQQTILTTTDHNPEHHEHYDDNSQGPKPISQPTNPSSAPEIEQPNKLIDGRKDYLGSGLASEACSLNRGCERRDRLNNTYLHHCTRHKLENLLSNEILMEIMHEDSSKCERVLGEFMTLDGLIDQFNVMFNNLISRYNCRNGYSVKWNCNDCKRAYKDWLCATNLPYYMNGERVKPCISFCERVEQRCPYLHPITKEQYGGQPVFICKDPNIPFVREITPDILYSEANKCYDLCHLNVDPQELKQDSLSKYAQEQCPAQTVLAEQVRSDPYYCEPDPAASIANRSQDHSSSPSTPLSPELNGAPDINSNTADGKEGKTLHVHIKMINQLREVLASYENQPKTHKFGHYSEHSSQNHQHQSRHHYEHSAGISGVALASDMSKSKQDGSVHW